jgi:hypothetical protein
VAGFADGSANCEERLVERAALGAVDDGAQLIEAHLDALAEVVGDDDAMRFREYQARGTSRREPRDGKR